VLLSCRMATKNPHAVALGRKGGKVTGVPKGTAALSTEERKRRASEAATARWDKERAKKGKKAAK
jgi:hypothetical protein